MSNSLIFRQAMNRVNAFENESVMLQHHEAMSCRDCEAFLQIGIEAFQWLIHADRGVRADAHENGTEWDDSVEAHLQKLFREWLGPCEFINNWIRELESRDYAIERREGFMKCWAEAQAIVEAFDDHDTTLPDTMADLRDAAVKDHSDGETAQFF